MAYYLHIHKGTACKGHLGPFATEAQADAQATEARALLPRGATLELHDKAQCAVPSRNTPRQRHGRGKGKGYLATSMDVSDRSLRGIERVEDALVTTLGPQYRPLARAGQRVRRGLMEAAPRALGVWPRKKNPLNWTKARGSKDYTARAPDGSRYLIFFEDRFSGLQRVGRDYVLWKYPVGAPHGAQPRDLGDFPSLQAAKKGAEADLAEWAALRKKNPASRRRKNSNTWMRERGNIWTTAGYQIQKLTSGEFAVLQWQFGAGFVVIGHYPTLAAAKRAAEGR